MDETTKTDAEKMTDLVAAVQRFAHGSTTSDAELVVATACAKWGMEARHAPIVTGALANETGYSQAAVLMALDVVGSFTNGPTGAWLLVQAGRRAAEWLQEHNLPMDPRNRDH